MDDQNMADEDAADKPNDFNSIAQPMGIQSGHRLSKSETGYIPPGAVAIVSLLPGARWIDKNGLRARCPVGR